jgi:hypothetical protein
MPVHDWTRVEAGIFHDFHHAWIEEIKRALNSGLLPPDYYAMAEQHAAGFGPDVLTLQSHREVGDEASSSHHGGNGGLLLAPPRQPITAETEMEFYRRKQNSVVVRHVSGDEIIAVVEVVFPGNKSGRNALRSFIEKAARFLDEGVHLLVLDLLPPGSRDPQGIHGEIWEEIAGQEYPLPPTKPLTLAAYESDLSIRCYVEHLSVGDSLPEMPLFLRPGGQVPMPLERTYDSAFRAVPGRWRTVLER